MEKLEEALEIADLIKQGKPVPCGKGPADEYILALAVAYREAMKDRCDLADKGHCGCAVDNCGDVCMSHHPLLKRAEKAEASLAEALAKMKELENEKRQVKGLNLAIVSDLKAKIAALEAERDFNKSQWDRYYKEFTDETLKRSKDVERLQALIQLARDFCEELVDFAAWESHPHIGVKFNKLKSALEEPV